MILLLTNSKAEEVSIDISDRSKDVFLPHPVVGEAHADDTPEAPDVPCAGHCQAFNHTTVYTASAGDSGSVNKPDWYTCCLIRARGVLKGSLTVTIDDTPAAHPALFLSVITSVSGDLTVIGNHRGGYTYTWSNLTEIGGRLLLFNVTVRLPPLAPRLLPRAFLNGGLSQPSIIVKARAENGTIVKCASRSGRFNR